MKYIKVIFVTTATVLLGVIVCSPCSSEAGSFVMGRDGVQGIEFRGTDRYSKGGVPFFSEPALLTKTKKQGEGDVVKLFSFVPASGEPVAEPDTQSERGYGPDDGPGKGNESGISIEKTARIHSTRDP